MSGPFLDFYRCPEELGAFALTGPLRTGPGYFRFGHDLVCFGQSSSGHCSRSPNNGLFDSVHSVSFNHAAIRLPFDLAEVIDNLRLERYRPPSNGALTHRTIQEAYYLLRPLLAVSLRKHLQKFFLRGWDTIPFPHWPVDTTVEHLFERLMALTLKSRELESVPFIWFWPEGASSCVMMTHDVEARAGAGFCSKLMDIDDAWRVRASFQIVPEERYPVTSQWLDSIRQRGFELNVQDLNHDGRLFKSRKEFLVRAAAINGYAKAFGSRGFRSAAMYRNPDWYEALDFSYDLSTPNSAHLEPQRGGCCTVFPYFIGKILELPLTTTQDYSLFHILNNYSIDLWKRQIRLIRERHGLISFIVHPDYVVAQRARDTYVALLEHLTQLREESNLWAALPGEVDQWWRQRSQMRLVPDAGRWMIQGPGSERARVAFATLHEQGLSYTVSNEGRPTAACA